MSAPPFKPNPVDSRKRADQVREGITAMIRAEQLHTGDMALYTRVTPRA